MKRSRSIGSPELPAPPRRQRSLSEDERELWESVARQLKPLRQKSHAAKPAAGIEPADNPAAAKSQGPAMPPEPAKATPAPPPRPAPPLAPLGRRERSQLSRGRKDIEARLDLHGMTQTRAHHALARFLQHAHAHGFTFVLIITGKGRSSAGESDRGILRRQVPLWLSLPEFRALVVGFEEAHIGHGGEGALYVRIRRGRR